MKPLGGSNKIRILVVDDQADWRYLVASTLRVKVKDACLEEANSSATAIEHLKKTTYSLVVCDYQMPGGSGLEVFDFLESNPESETAFILFTASPDIQRLKEKMIVVSKSAVEELLDAITFLGIGCDR